MTSCPAPCLLPAPVTPPHGRSRCRAGGASVASARVGTVSGAASKAPSQGLVRLDLGHDTRPVDPGAGAGQDPSGARLCRIRSPTAAVAAAPAASRSTRRSGQRGRAFARRATAHAVHSDHGRQTSRARRVPSRRPARACVSLPPIRGAGHAGLHVLRELRLLPRTPVAHGAPSSSTVVEARDQAHTDHGDDELD